MTSQYEEHMNLKVAGADRAGYDDELENDDFSEDDAATVPEGTRTDEDEVAPQLAAASLPIGKPATESAGADTARSARAEPAPAGPQISAERLSEEWREIQASFVDDPRGAVQMAAEAAEGVLTTLVTSLRDRQAALGPTANQDTEQLRATLQEYRKFYQGLAEASRRMTAG